jgi:hypothetical protein
MTTTKAGKKAGATKKGTKNEGGIPLLVNGKTPASVDAMERALQAFGVKPSAETLANPEKLLEIVREKVAEKVKGVAEQDLLECEKCGETSTDATDFCPFCGESESEGKPEAGDGASDATALARSTEAGIDAKRTALEQAEAEIASLQADVKRNAYKLGEVIKRVHEEELWKAKGYGDFAEWVGKETQITRQYSYDLMKLTKEFDEETFVKAGPGKLLPLLAVKDAEKRSELVTQATNGASAKTIRTAAASAKGKGKGSKAPAREPGKGAPPKEDGLTFVGKIAKRPETHSFRSKETGRPIKHFAPGAYVEIEIARDVRLRIGLDVTKEGEPTGITTLFVKAE